MFDRVNGSVSIANDGNSIIFVKEIANNEIQDHDGNLGGQKLRLDRDERSDMAVSRGERDVNGRIHGDRGRSETDGTVRQGEVRRSVPIRSDERGALNQSKNRFYRNGK